MLLLPPDAPDAQPHISIGFAQPQILIQNYG